MITAAELKARTVKDLAAMAKKRRVPGWHSMRKNELIKALVSHARSRTDSRHRSTPAKKKGPATRPDRLQKPPSCSRVQHQLNQIKTKLAESKDLAFRSVANGEGNGSDKDRLVLLVRDPYWLHAYWELTRASIDRARAALGKHWHAARPILRLCEISRDGNACSSVRILRDIQIHGGVNNWYIDVRDPPKSYQIDIGYLALGSRFFSVVRSNVVTTPPVGAGATFDENWTEVAKDYDRIYAMSGGYADQDGNRELKEVFEERLQRPMGDPMTTRFGLGAATPGTSRPGFPFQVATELIVHGVTDPDAHLTLRGEPVQLRNDGTFAVCLTLPDRRHVLPLVASSSDGVEQQTIVLAIDRNTKVMEPLYRDPGQ